MSLMVPEGSGRRIVVIGLTVAEAEMLRRGGYRTTLDLADVGLPGTEVVLVSGTDDDDLMGRILPQLGRTDQDTRFVDRRRRSD